MISASNDALTSERERERERDGSICASGNEPRMPQPWQAAVLSTCKESLRHFGHSAPWHLVTDSTPESYSGHLVTD